MVSKCKSKPQSQAGLLQIVFAVLALAVPVRPVDHIGVFIFH